MKKTVLLALAVMVAVLPVCSSCDLFGGKSKEEKAFERQLEAIKAQQEADERARQEYMESVQESLNQYMKEYQEYANAQYEQQLADAQKQLDEMNAQDQ